MRFVVAIAFLLVASSADAQMIQRSCAGKRDNRTCTTVFTGPIYSGPSVIDVGEVRRADADQWRRFCQPRIVVDQYGVERFVYAHPGCEFGRSR